MISLIVESGKRWPISASPSPYTHLSLRQYARGRTDTRPERVCLALSSDGVSRLRMYKLRFFNGPFRLVIVSTTLFNSCSCRMDIWWLVSRDTEPEALAFFAGLESWVSSSGSR